MDLQGTLADRYHIERELGQGGMATVYLARDLKHDRLVALKVLRPEVSGVLGPERFVREIETAAGLNHPHILPLFDSGQAGDPVTLFYVMPFVDGESLRDRLTREGKLSIPEAVRIAGEVAGALEYAHQHGIVHRDIKPENILLQAGQAVVADFGIARAVDVAGEAPAGGRLTSTGLVIGSPRYMSPEQISGGPITGQSDVYSLGCVLYEMLAGDPPFDGPTAQAVLGAHATAEAPPLRRRRPEVSRALEATVLGALGKTPEARFATAGRLAESLATGAAPRRRITRRQEWTVSGIALAVLLAAVAWWAGRNARLAQPRGVAVLYLDNRSGDSAVQYLADGITEEMILRLGQVSRLGVPSRGAVRRFRGRVIDDPGAVGSALGVTHFVSGSIETGGAAGMRIRVDLVEAGTGKQIWGSSFTLGDRDDLFAVEDSIARAVAGGVAGRLAPAEASAVTKHRTANPEAYEHYLKGNFYLSRRTGEADGRRALQEYEAALQLDPRFAEALARLGLVYGIYASWPWQHPSLTTDSLLSRGMDAANRAIALDSTSAEAWISRGFLLIPIPADQDAFAGFRAAPGLSVGGRGICWSRVPDCRSQAIAALARAVRLAPRNAEAWYQYGRSQLATEASDSAIARSLMLEPDRAVSAWLLGMRRLMHREFESAEVMLDSAVALGRRDLSVYSLRLETRLAQGDTLGARADLESYRALIGSDPVAAAYHASSLVALDGRAGRVEAARARADSLARAHPPDTRETRSILVVVAAALVASGDTDRGLAVLDRAVGSPGAGFWSTLASPRWDPVRNDPRFRAIAARQPDN